MNRNSFQSGGVNLSQVNMNTQNINNVTRAIAKLRNEITTSFIKLSDTPSFFGAAGQVVATNSTGTGLVFVNQPTAAPTTLDGLTDTALTNTAGNHILQYSSTTQNWENAIDLTLPGTLTCPNVATFEGEFKARSFIHIGDDANSDKCLFSNDTIDIHRYDSSTSSSHNIFRSTKDTNNNCKVNINANDGSEALVLTGVHPTAGSTGSNHKTIESKQGLVYLTNSFGDTNGINSDNVGLMQLKHNHTTNILGVDYLQIASDYITSNYPSYTSNISNLINLINKSRTDYDYSMMNVDVGGKTTFRSNEITEQFTIHNTYKPGYPIYNYNETIFHVKGHGQRVAPYKYDFETGDPVNSSGFTFAKFSHMKAATATSVNITGGGGTGAFVGSTNISYKGTIESINLWSGGSGYTSAPTVTINGSGINATAVAVIDGSGVVTSINITNPGEDYDPGSPDVAFQVDGDGSVKCKESISILGTTSGSLTWPPTGNNTYNLTFVSEDTHNGHDNRGSWITTEYSNDSDGCPLYLKAFGTNVPQGGTKRVKNMVNVVENEVITDSSNNDYSEIHFCLRNKSSVDHFDNYLWLNNRTELEGNDGYYITSYKKLTGNRKFGIRKTGILYDDPSDFNSSQVDSHIIRYDPNNYTGHFTTMGTDGAYLTIGDDRKQIVRIGSGTQRYASGTTFNLNPSVNPNISGSILDVQTIFGDNILCRNLDSGNANSTLSIGNKTNTKNVVIEMGHATAQSSINLGDEGCITCTSASNFATGSTGPTNICNANHNGYIGTWSANPLTGTGVRCNTIMCNLNVGAAKFYTARLPPDLGYDNQEYFHPTCVESPQGLIIYRGQLEVRAQTCTLSLDNAMAVADCNVIVPHTVPKSMIPGTFNAMFKNPTVHVTNAGIRDPVQIDTLTYQPDFTQVFGTIIKVGVPPNENSILQISCHNNPPNGMCVNYVIYAERKDDGYNNLGAAGGYSLIQPYTNPFLGGKTTTFNSVSTVQQFMSASGINLEPN